jgi:hypothetical protein
MGKFSKKLQPAKTVNKAGGFAYSHDVQTELVFAVLTTFLDDKYYEKGAERISRIEDLVLKNKPEFVANLAVVARKEFNLRSVSTLLIGLLARTHKGDSLVKDTIVKAATRVDDLTELVAYMGTPLPKQVKRGVRNALFKFNRYQLAKYKGEGNEVSLVDVFNLVHPKVQHASEEQAQAWADLMKGNLKSFDTWETEISNCKPEEKKSKWQSLVAENKLGYMALLRNLNNLIKVGVEDQYIDMAVGKLSDEAEVRKSKQLPFRFVTAYENVSGNRKLSNAISVAMDIAVGNAPKFEGNTLIAVDVSGSMSGDPINKASIFAATLFKSHPNADLILFDERVSEVNIGDRLPVIDLAQQIKKLATGGGTNTSLVFQFAEKKGKKYDRIIILSDNQSWQDSYGWGSTGGTQKYYEAYRKIADPVVYAIDIQGYGTKDITAGKVFHLAGWSERVLDFIKESEKGNALIKYIEDYK